MTTFHLYKPDLQGSAGTGAVVKHHDAGARKREGNYGLGIYRCLGDLFLAEADSPRQEAEDQSVPLVQSSVLTLLPAADLRAAARGCGAAGDGDR